MIMCAVDLSEVSEDLPILTRGNVKTKELLSELTNKANKQKSFLSKRCGLPILQQI